MYYYYVSEQDRLDIAASLSVKEQKRLISIRRGVNLWTIKVDKRLANKALAKLGTVTHRTFLTLLGEEVANTLIELGIEE